jgi:SNF family Na+-dependent transporter
LTIRRVACSESAKGLGGGMSFAVWRFTVRYVAPVVLLILLIAGLMN